MRISEAYWVERYHRWQVNVQRDGKRKTFTSTLTGRKGKLEAERKADRWLEDPTSAETVQVGRLLDQYEEYLKGTKSAGHASQYCGFIRLYIRPVIGLIRINRLTEGDLQDVIDRAYASRKLSAKTLRDIRGCMMGWLKWCRQHGKTRLYPETLAIPAGAKRPEKRIVSPDGIITLFRSDMTTWRGKPVQDWYIHAYRFAVITGLRPGELTGLEDKSDIKGSKVIVRRSINVRREITQGKNHNAQRTFQLPEIGMEEVKAQRAMLKEAGMISPYLFPGPDGGPLVNKNFIRAWKRYCRANGTPETTLYELRHTYVSINKEMPEGLKKMVIGHSRDMDTEGTYGHVMAGDLQKAADYTGQAINSNLCRK